MLGIVILRMKGRALNGDIFERNVQTDRPRYNDFCRNSRTPALLIIAIITFQVASLKAKAATMPAKSIDSNDGASNDSKTVSGSRNETE